MKEFFVNLYSNPSFPIYLGAVIVVLVIAFFVVWFLGKKDKKNYDLTQQMQAITTDTFNETTVSKPVEVSPQTPITPYQEVVNQTPVIEQPVMQTTPVVEQPVVPPVAPVVNQAPVMQAAPVVEQPVAPVMETAPVIEQPIVQPEPIIQQPVVEQPVASVMETTPVIEQPIVQPQPIIQQPVVSNYESIDNQVNDQIENLHNIANSISSELDSLQEEQDKFKALSSQQPENVQPVFSDNQNHDIVIEPAPIVKPTYNQNNIFSSVYAPEKTMPVIENDDDEIELPKLK